MRPPFGLIDGALVAHLAASGIDLAGIPGRLTINRRVNRIDWGGIELGDDPHFRPVGVGAVEVGHALLVVTRHQRRISGLKAHQLALEGVTARAIRIVFPVAIPVGVEHVGSAVKIEAAIGSLLPAGVLLIRLDRDLVVVGQPFPVADAIDRLPLVLVLLATLDAAVDDVDGGTKAVADTGIHFAFGGYPGAINHVQHGRFRGLRGEEEPDGRSEVEPGVRHQPRVVEQHGGIAIEHRLGEGTVVEVVRKLLGAAAEVPLTRAAWPLLVLPVVLATAGGIAGLSL